MSETLDRLDRVLALVPWLLANPGARMSEIAERFGTTHREIASDLDVLGYCGVPGYGGGDLVEVVVAGDQVHVHMADYFRRPLRLRLHEAMTLLLAARALLGGPELADPGALRRAVAKLEEALGAAEVAVDLAAPEPALLERVRHAATHGRVVRLVYRSTGREEETRRDVEPWAVIAAGGAWYLRGYCRLADAPRDFRVDRIRRADVTDEQVAERPERATADKPAYRPGDEDVDVVLAIDPEVAWLLDAVPGATSIDEKTVRFPARSIEWAARLVLSLGGAARVLEPAALRTRTAELATAAGERYRRTSHPESGASRA